MGLPFNEYMVYALNAMLVFHALMLHSACDLRYPGTPPHATPHTCSRVHVGVLGWLLFSPIDHNTHHVGGKANAHNFGAIFKV